MVKQSTEFTAMKGFILVYVHLERMVKGNPSTSGGTERHLAIFSIYTCAW